VDPDPAAVPAARPLGDAAPGAHARCDRAGDRSQPVASALVALDLPGGAQPGERDADAVARDPEERAGLDEGGHGHGSASQRREQVEDQAAGGGRHAGDITVIDRIGQST
jgi:hypothetical protein